MNNLPYNPEGESFFGGTYRGGGLCSGIRHQLCIENIEVEDYTKVLDMIEKVNRENFRMTLDVGHLALSTTYFGCDFEVAIKECIPYVGHVHLNDNTLSFEEMRIENFMLYQTMDMGYRITFGRGDIHLPPFWGKVPMEWVLETLHEADYNGIYICEYENNLYVPFHKGIQENVRQVITGIRNRYNEGK